MLTASEIAVTIICALIAMCFIDDDDVGQVLALFFIVPVVSIFIHWLIELTWEYLKEKIDESSR